MRDWIRKYQAEGEVGLRISRGWKPYMKEQRLAAISDVLPIDQTTKEKYIKEDTKKGEVSRNDNNG